MLHSQRSRGDGFTLIELLIVLTILLMAALIGFPALNRTIRRTQLEGAAQELASAARLARLEAIRRSAPTVVVLDTATNQVSAFVDLNDNDPDADGDFVGSDLKYNPDDAPTCPPNTIAPGCLPENAKDFYVVEKMQLTQKIKLGGPTADPAVVTGFTDRGDGPRVVFNPNGSVLDIGSYRVNDGIKDDGDQILNSLEVRVSPAAAGRIQLLKWNKNDGTWYTRDLKNGKSTWEWY